MEPSPFPARAPPRRHTSSDIMISVVIPGAFATVGTNVNRPREPPSETTIDMHCLPSLLRRFFTLRSITTLALAATAASMTPVGTARAAETNEAQTEDAREVVDLELKIAADGQAVGQIAQLVELDTETALALEADGHQHAIAITVRKADERGHKLAVTVGYQRDGEAVLETVTVEAAAKKAKVVRSEGGDVALSLKLAPKRVPVEEAPASRRKVEVEDTNDPLAGL